MLPSSDPTSATSPPPPSQIPVPISSNPTSPPLPSPQSAAAPPASTSSSSSATPAAGTATSSTNSRSGPSTITTTGTTTTTATTTRTSTSSSSSRAQSSRSNAASSPAPASSRRTSSSLHQPQPQPASPARAARIGAIASSSSTPSTSSAAATGSMLPTQPPALPPSLSTAATAPTTPSASTAQLTAAQALAQQSIGAHGHHQHPSIFASIYSSGSAGESSRAAASTPATGTTNAQFSSAASTSSTATAPATGTAGAGPATSPTNSNNPSTRILSSANLSTPVPSSASSSATFLTGRSHASSSTGQTTIAGRHGSHHQNPLVMGGGAGGSGSNTPSRAGLANNNNSFIPGLPFPLSLGLPTNPMGSPRMNASQHIAGIYTAASTSSSSANPSSAVSALLAPHNNHPAHLAHLQHFHQQNHGAAAGGFPTQPQLYGMMGLSNAAQQSLGFGQAGGGGIGGAGATAGLGIGGSRSSPTLRNASIGGGGTTSFPGASTLASGSMGGSAAANAGSGFPAWYRHTTSGLLPLLEVPSAVLSAATGAANNANRGTTATTSALLRNTAALTSRGGPGDSSAAGGPTRRSTSSRLNNNSSTTPTTAAAGQQASAALPNPLHAGPIPGGAMSEDTVVSFSWVIGELALLRDEVERTMPPGDEGRSVSAGAGRNPVWTTQPCFGDPKLPKWKLELVRTQRNRTNAEDEYDHSDEPVDDDGQNRPRSPGAQSEDGASAVTPRADATTVLSVYLTSLALEYLPSDALIPATIMLGLQPARTTLSRLQARDGAYLWKEYASFVFRREHEFFECHSLPTLSELLDNFEEVRAQDAVKLTVQIGCGPGIVGSETDGVMGAAAASEGWAGTGAASGGAGVPFFPRLAPFQVPSAHYVSQTILDALEGLVDCSRTGDVRIIVRERGLLIHPPAVAAAAFSDDGHSAEYGDEDEEAGRFPRHTQLQAQQPYVIPYPVGSFFPLDLIAPGPAIATAEGGEEHNYLHTNHLDHSGVLPPLDPTQALDLGMHSNGAAATASASVVVRDRIIWAHSSVLRARSQYFADMIDGSFAEAQDELDDTPLRSAAAAGPSTGYGHSSNGARAGAGGAAAGPSRAVKTFRIPDAEWATVYWLIRYLYLEEIEFAEREDVRSSALDNDWMISAEGLFPSDFYGQQQHGSVHPQQQQHHHHQDDGPGANLWGTGSEYIGGEGASSSSARRNAGLRVNWEWRTIADLLREEEEAHFPREHETPTPHAHQHDHPMSAAPPPPQEQPAEELSSSMAPAAPPTPTTTSLSAKASGSPSSSWRGHPGTIYSSSHPPPKSNEPPPEFISHGQQQHVPPASSSSSAGQPRTTTNASSLSSSSHSSLYAPHETFAQTAQGLSVGGSGGGGHRRSSSSGAAAGSAHASEEGGNNGSSGRSAGGSSTTPVPHEHPAQDHGDVNTSTNDSALPMPGACHYDHQPHGRRRPHPQSTPTFHDPHEHPAAQAPPASALATYKLAHRYGQAGLAELAKAHMIETLTPPTAFPVLLATALYGQLHEAVKRYVYEHWEEVSHTEEFERCCDEVGAGEWGAEAGRALRIFMQSLLSPARLLFASPPR